MFFLCVIVTLLFLFFPYSCQLTLCELEKQNKDLVCQYSALEKTKKEKIEEMKQLVRAEEKKLEDLSEQLKEQQQKTKEHKERLKQCCQHLKQDQLELTDEYHRKSIKLGETVTSSTFTQSRTVGRCIILK